MAHEMQRAFDAWAMYSGLKFKRVDDPRAEVDILIQFSYQYHYDDFPFDGPGGVLAHAFYPYERARFSGQIHFDEEEPWVVNATSEQIMNGQYAKLNREFQRFNVIRVCRLGYRESRSARPFPRKVERKGEYSGTRI